MNLCGKRAYEREQEESSKEKSREELREREKGKVDRDCLINQFCCISLNGRESYIHATDGRAGSNGFKSMLVLLPSIIISDNPKPVAKDKRMPQHECPVAM